MISSSDSESVEARSAAPVLRTPVGATLQRVMLGAFYVFLASEFFSIAVNSIALGVMAICWVLMMLVERKVLITRTPFDWFFLAYLVVQIITTVFSQDVVQSIVFSKRLLLIGIVYFISTWIVTEALVKRTVVVLLGAGIAVSLIGLAKLVLSPPGEIVRLGIFQFYMTTSELMMIAFLLLLPFAVMPRVPIKVRIVAAVTLLPVIVALYATVTRGPFVAAVIGALVIALIANRRLVIALVAGIAILFMFASPYVLGRLESITNIHHHDNQTRLMLWRIGLESFREHPVLGVGDTDLGDLIGRHMRPDDPIERLGHMHNIVMQFLVTEGAVGLTAILLLFVAIVVAEARIFRRVQTHWFPAAVSLGAIAVFIGFQIAGLTDWTFGDQEVVILFWISVGLSLAVNKVVPELPGS
ncbi:MAG TPA: O-antigen ligase family protein [Bacteroidota bacterium]|nr:O-antigen ligase family protein [Bacteroidota bacterium]